MVGHSMKQSILKAIILTASVGLIPYGVDAVEVQNASLSASRQYTNIVELIVFAIISAALIISVLVLSLGRWAGHKDKKAIKAIRHHAEQDQKEITSVVESIRQHEKDTTIIVRGVNALTHDFSSKRKEIDEYEKSILESSNNIKQQEQELIQTTNSISLRMNKIQAYWDSQLDSTIATIQEVQAHLDSNLNKVDNDLETMQSQKVLSQELLQDFLGKHQEQSHIINNNFDISEKVGQTLEETLRESTTLIGLLQQHQNSAEKSLEKFTSELTGFEEQAYEQFDSSFQVADIARQELTANIDESRTHIESMRRHEELSNQLNNQTQKNLEALDYSKITKISSTLDSTQDMFTDIRHKVEDTKKLLDELKDIETDVRKSARLITSDSEKTAEDTLESSLFESYSNDKGIDLSANIYKMASGDNTPLSFFTKVKKRDKE